MNKRDVVLVGCAASCAVILSVVAGAVSFGQESKPASTSASGAAQDSLVALPKPATEGGKPLMEALKNRQSSREFGQKKLPEQVLSNLLWAAFGVNRADSGKRTAPSANDRRPIDIYVATGDGLWLFDAERHGLVLVHDGDIRVLTGKQGFVKDAAVNLIYVADWSKMGQLSEDDKRVTAGIDTGVIAQNVSLFCSSEGLATVVRGAVDKPPLAGAMKLRADQVIILAQSVGYPKQD